MEQSLFDILMQTNNAKAKFNENGEKILQKRQSQEIIKQISENGQLNENTKENKK